MIRHRGVHWFGFGNVYEIPDFGSGGFVCTPDTTAHIKRAWGTNAAEVRIHLFLHTLCTLLSINTYLCMYSRIGHGYTYMGTREYMYVHTRCPRFVVGALFILLRTAPLSTACPFFDRANVVVPSRGVESESRESNRTDAYSDASERTYPKARATTRGNHSHTRGAGEPLVGGRAILTSY